MPPMDMEEDPAFELPGDGVPRTMLKPPAVFNPEGPLLEVEADAPGEFIMEFIVPPMLEMDVMPPPGLRFKENVSPGIPPTPVTL